MEEAVVAVNAAEAAWQRMISALNVFGPVQVVVELPRMTGLRVEEQAEMVLGAARVEVLV